MASEPEAFADGMWYEWPTAQRETDARRWRSAPLAVLDLPARVANALSRSGAYGSVGELMLAGEEVASIRWLGIGSLRSIHQALAPLFRGVAALPEGGPAMPEAAAARADAAGGGWMPPDAALQVDPGAPLVDPGAPVRDAVLALLERWIRARLDDRRWDILRQRFGLDGLPRRTLQEVGDAYGLTRERIRQLESSAINDAVVFAAHPWAWPSVAAPAALDPRVASTWEDLLSLLRGFLDGSVAEEELAHRAHALIESESDGLDPLVAFAAIAVGLARHPSPTGSGALWGHPDGLDAALVARSKWLGTFLTQETAAAWSVEELVELIHRRFPAEPPVSAEDTRRALALSGVLECLPDGRYRARYEHLGHRDLRVERVLRDAGQPMHLTEIRDTLLERPLPNGARPMGLRRVWRRLRQDDRFVPVGASGYWTLRDLVPDDGATVLDLMERCLAEAGEPLAASEVFRYLASRRPTSIGSVEAFLAGDDRFLPLDVELWSLASWPVPWSRRRWDRRGTARFLARRFEQAGRKQLPLEDLISAIAREAGLPHRVARSMIATNPAIVVRASGDGGVVARMRKDFGKLMTLTMPRSRRRPERRLVVHERVVTELRSRPDKSMPLAVLRETLMRDLGLPASSIDAYLRRMPDVERVPWPGHRGRLIRLRE